MLAEMKQKKFQRKVTKQYFALFLAGTFPRQTLVEGSPCHGHVITCEEHFLSK